MKKLLILFAFSAIFLSACSSSEGDNDLGKVTNSGSIQYVESFSSSLDDISYDWGDISIEGGLATYSFPFKNTGEDDLILKTMVTSCACTTAEVVMSDGTKSPIFDMGMRGSTDWNYPVPAGDEFEVNITFDPMFHGPDGVGAISRSIMLTTSADNLSKGQLEMKVFANVLYEEDYQGLESTQEADELSYEQITAASLASMLPTKDFFLLDVHIPEQEHIEGTDAFIPYNDLESFASDLPEDKDTEIVVYCRSGGMSPSAAKELLDMGYTNVSELEGGINAYNEL